MLKRPDQRVAVLIDTQNMYHSAKNLYNAKVNFGALVEAAVGPRQMVRTIAYVAKSKGGIEGGFFEALQSVGIELKIKDVQEFSGGAKKADWDVGMAIDAVALAPKVDAIVLATGDGDFVPLVEYLQTHGVACECIAFGESTNATLRERVNEFTNLSDEPAQYLIGYRGKSKSEKKETIDKGESREKHEPTEAPVITFRQEAPPSETVKHEISNTISPAPEALIPTKSKDIKHSNSILSAITSVAQSPYIVQAHKALEHAKTQVNSSLQSQPTKGSQQQNKKKKMK